MEKTVDEIGFLTASHARVRTLQTLHVVGPLSKADLHRRVEASQTTIGRHLDALEGHGYVAYDSTVDRYKLTARGTAVAKELSSVLETMDVADQLTRFLHWVPDGTLDFELRQLSDAEVVYADPHDPYAPVNHHVETVQETSRFRCLLPSIGRNQMRKITESVDEGEEYRIVFERGILEAILSDERYKQEIMKVNELENFEISVFDGDIPYFLGIYDEVVHVGVENKDGILQALLESSADAVVEWAEDTYVGYRNAATPFT